LFGGLLYVDCDESTIKGLLAFVTGNSIDELVSIARIATEHGLYEEALGIYKKHEQHA
jgi:hypothetical protein